MSLSENEPLLTHHIYLVRHGEVDVPTGVCYGHLDCAVSNEFDAERIRLINYFTSAELLEKSSNCSPLIISSPLARCYQLAQSLKQVLDSQCNGADLQVNKAFQEINFGEWEGRSWQDIGQEPIECWNNDLLDYTFPNGENTRSFDQRVIHAWNELTTQLATKTSSKTVIIVAHAGVIRSILSHFLHIPLQHSLLLSINKLSASHLNISPQHETLSRCIFINNTL